IGTLSRINNSFFCAYCRGRACPCPLVWHERAGGPPRPYIRLKVLIPMNAQRLILFATAIVVTSSFTIQAQRRWERLPAPRDPQFYEPRNKLEDFEGRVETVLIRGRHWVGTLRAQNGTARVEATEIR